MQTTGMASGFAYLPGGKRPFSAGVIARPGHALVRVRPRAALPLAEGLDLVIGHLAARGLPRLALAALELRMPSALTPADFVTFNGDYATLLRERGLLPGEAFPIARSNMAPLFDPPATAMLNAFTYAAPADAAPAGFGRRDAGAADFVISGKPELREDPLGIIAPDIVAGGDTSPAGMAEKARFVIDALRATTVALGGDWRQLTGAHAYTTRPLDGAMGVLRESGLASLGITLVAGYPPVTGLDFEVDVRAIATQLAV